MARRSNKTAHVLNLLAGNDDKKEKESEVIDDSAAEDSAAEISSDSPSVAAPESAAPVTPAQSVSVIDKTEEDPLAALIEEKLTEEFEKEFQKAGIAPVAQEETPVTEDETPVPTEPTISIPEVQTEKVDSTEMPAEPTVTAAPEAPVEEPAPAKAPASAAEPAIEPQPEPEVEPEPDFVMVNVIEEIVKDKIIYFMRQFDVCTCERCKADTIALTLNGLAPKYIVTEPATVSPLMSFYTNKYIADITVEATKACMTIKENPRH